MAGRSDVAASSTMAMENLRLIRLESRIHAFLSESRERLLHMQVLRGVLNRERMLLRITAQERDMASLKKEQCRLQEEVAELRSLSAQVQKDGGAAIASEVSWTQLQNRLQSFVDSPAHQRPSSGDPGVGRSSKMATSTSPVNLESMQGKNQLSVGVSCEGDTPFTDPAVEVVPQRRGRRPGRGRGGRRGGAGRGGRRGGRGRRQSLPPSQQPKKLVVGDSELVNLDMLGALGLLGSPHSGHSGTRVELSHAEVEECPLPPTLAVPSASGHVEGQREVRATSSGAGTQEVNGVNEGDNRNDEGDGRNDEDDKRNDESGKRKESDGRNDKGDRRNDENDSRNDEGDGKNDESEKRNDENERRNESDGRNDEGDQRNDEDHRRNDEDHRRNDEDDRRTDEGVRRNDEGDRRNDEDNRRNDESDRKTDEGDRRNDESDRRNDEGDRRNDEGDRRTDEGDRRNGEGDRRTDEGDRRNGEGNRRNDEGDRRNGESIEGNGKTGECDGGVGRGDCAKGRCSEGERSRSDEGDAEDRENKCRKRGDSTVLVADSGDVAQEVPMGAQELPVEEQQEDMVVTLSATATPSVSVTNPDVVMVSKVGGGSDVAAEGVHGEGRCEPPASKPGKRRGRPPKDSSKRKKMEDGSKEADNSSFAHVDQSGKDVALDACEEVGVAPSRMGRGRKTISKLQSSFLPDVPAPSEPLGKAPFTWKGFRAPIIKCNPPKLLKVAKEKQ